MAGIPWRGYRACQCVIDATAEYERLAKYSLLRLIFQVCYSWAAASAGTHGGGGAMDTVSLSNARILIARRIGFWPSNRYTWQGFADPHAHWVLFGCPHAPKGLQFQESELRANRDGLRGRARDRFPRPAKIVTWRQYKAAQIAAANAKRQLVIMGKTYKPIGSVSVYWLEVSRRLGTFSRHTYWVQVWLRKLGYYRGPLDGKWGKVTQAAVDNFRRKALKFSAADSRGAIGPDALAKLRNAAKSTLKTRTGK